MSTCDAGVVLVLQPFADLQRPSIALGLLRAGLARAGVAAEVIYGNLRFAERVGLAAYRALLATPTDHLLGEWCFSRALFPGFAPDDDAYLELTLGADRATREHARAMRAAAPAFLDALAAEIAARGPRIVGCSSTFQQHCASLALLERVRALRPEILTVLGGANCEGEMGVETLRLSPALDFAVSGEADRLFPELCRLLLEHGRDADPTALPHGVIARSSLEAPVGSRPPRATVRELDPLPTPDYDDYFAQLARSPLRGHLKIGLPVESSRGCWWGEKSHCTFCGLNGSGMGYRAKTGARVLEELAELTARYGVYDLQLVDNILDPKHLATVLEPLERENAARDGARYNLFYETKSNLKREQVATLARAGARWLQPGIESLHDGALALIAKGNGAAMNVQLMKWAREHGVRLSWNVLCALPGESESWYLEMADRLPLLFHLEPPAVVVRVRYDRFSPYHMRPREFGLELVPCRTYGHVYPLPEDGLSRLAYYFEDRRHLAPELHRGYPLRPAHQALDRVVRAWQAAWRDGPPTLYYDDRGDRLVVHDERPCARAERFVLEGRAADVYRLCDRAHTRASLRRVLPHPGLDPNLDALVDAGLMLELDGKYLSLAVEGPPAPLPRGADFPGGYVSLEPLAIERVADSRLGDRKGEARHGGRVAGGGKTGEIDDVVAGVEGAGMEAEGDLAADVGRQVVALPDHP